MAVTEGKVPVVVSWSGGKDSCFALYETQMAPDYRVAALLTTLTRDFDRVSMHGVRRQLVEEQAASLGFPLHQVFISKGFTHPVEFSLGEIVLRESFWFCDLVPK